MIIYGKKKPNIYDINNLISDLAGKINKIYSTILVSSDHLESISQYFEKTKDQLEEKMKDSYNYILEMHYGLAKNYNNNQSNHQANQDMQKQINEQLKKINQYNQPNNNKKIEEELVSIKSILNNISDDIQKEKNNIKSIIDNNNQKINQIIQQEQLKNSELIKQMRSQILYNNKSIEKIKETTNITKDHHNKNSIKK